MSLLVAAFLALAGTAAAASASLAELLAREAEASEALHTQTELQHLLTLLVEVESGQRGYLLTGQPSFLRPYEQARAALAPARAAVRARLARGGPGPAALDRLDALIDQQLARAQGAVQRRQQRGDVAVPDLPDALDSQRVMKELHRHIDQWVQDQQLAADGAQAAAQAVRQRTARLTGLLAAAGLLTGLAAFLLIRRERQWRDRADSALRRVNAGLEQQVAQRTAALREALARIRGDAAERDRSFEAERRRLARDIHDQVGQVGTAIQLLTRRLRTRLAPQEAPLLDELQGLAQETIQAARQISARLRPPLLDELGLQAALEHHLGTVARQSGLATELCLTQPDVLPAERADALFRIVQEACTNVLRHADATRLWVVGRPVDAVSAATGVPGYEIEVIDDGCGPGAPRADASGLRNMRDRAVLAGGCFEFGPAPGGGTRVRACVPLGLAPPPTELLPCAC